MSGGVIYAVGPDVATVQIPWRPFPCDVRQWKVLHIVIDEVSGALSMPYGLFVVPAGMTVMLGLHNPPCSWTGTVVPPYPASI
jgi:hypothetical protein